VTRPAGSGYYVVGDAAAILDPASSHGVLKAVLSGMLAARMMVKALAFGDGVTEARRYGQWVNDRFEHDVAGLRALYARLPRPPHWI
jgi:flavin-dependent dehydrogenase